MIELVYEASGYDFSVVTDPSEARVIAKQLGVVVTGKESWGQVIELVFTTLVEPMLITPVHVTDFPREVSPLAKEHRLSPRLSTVGKLLTLFPN
jgi:lysyl-tRNA synthetase class 2